MFQDYSHSTFGRLLAVAALVLLLESIAWSTSYKVLHDFTSKNNNPSSGLTTDSEGNAYGTTSAGGHDNAGTVYELSPTTGYHLLYAFSHAGSGGRYPQGNLVLDAAGNLYGTTVYGGLSREDCESRSCGLVFELSPPSGGVGLWTETVLYSFCSKASCPDGANPQSGVIMDAVGNLYGATYYGGAPPGGGAVFELTPGASGWTETILYSFSNDISDGEFPYGGLIFDAVGNLYGTTLAGGVSNLGTVFELSPVGGAWAETVLHSFGGGDGAKPFAGLVLDAAGNLYGTTIYGGKQTCGGLGCGTVFEFTPSAEGGWTETVLHQFAGGASDGELPQAGVILDSSGNIYGTTSQGGKECSGLSCGTVFMLTAGGDGQWTESVFRFPGGRSGEMPTAPLTFDAAGSLYGTTTVGGNGGGGTVFRISQ
jgi:uncharacterized repeat protein (TIGR03803 family)